MRSGIKCVGNLLLPVFLLFASPTAFGAFIFNVQQVSQRVLITGGGTLNISALTFSHSGVDTGALVDGSLGFLGAGPTSGTSTLPYSQYTGISGPVAFGPGGLVSASSGVGDGVGVGLGTNLAVPVGYTSGSSLADSSVFNSATIASLGLTPGTYVYTWGSGQTADSLTINIGTSVPEPASLAMIAVPLGVAQLRRRRGRRPS